MYIPTHVQYFKASGECIVQMMLLISVKHCWWCFFQLQKQLQTPRQAQRLYDISKYRQSTDKLDKFYFCIIEM